MKKYLAITIETDPVLRATRLAFERDQGGRIYRRPDGSHVVVRPDGAPWPPYSAPQPAPDDLDAAGWVEEV